MAGESARSRCVSLNPPLSSSGPSLGLCSTSVAVQAHPGARTTLHPIETIAAPLQWFDPDRCCLATMDPKISVVPELRMKPSGARLPIAVTWVSSKEGSLHRHPEPPHSLLRS